MTTMSNLLLGLALPCAVVGVVLMMAMAGALQARGQKINWVWIRLYILKYIGQYHKVTVQETGRPGPLFYPFVVSMNSALLFAVAGLVLRAM
jgi:hypothetical protein